MPKEFNAENYPINSPHSFIMLGRVKKRNAIKEYTFRRKKFYKYYTWVHVYEIYDVERGVHVASPPPGCQQGTPLYKQKVMVGVNSPDNPWREVANFNDYIVYESKDKCSDEGFQDVSMSELFYIVPNSDEMAPYAGNETIKKIFFDYIQSLQNWREGALKGKAKKEEKREAKKEKILDKRRPKKMKDYMDIVGLRVEENKVALTPEEKLLFGDMEGEIWGAETPEGIFVGAIRKGKFQSNNQLMNEKEIVWQDMEVQKFLGRVKDFSIGDTVKFDSGLNLKGVGVLLGVQGAGWGGNSFNLDSWKGCAVYIRTEKELINVKAEHVVVNK